VIEANRDASYDLLQDVSQLGGRHIAEASAQRL
jgi:hypothetical protein